MQIYTQLLISQLLFSIINLSNLTWDLVYEQKELAKKGWRETTLKNFLDLTPEETAYIELKLLLSKILKERRESLH